MAESCLQPGLLDADDAPVSVRWNVLARLSAYRLAGRLPEMEALANAEYEQALHLHNAQAQGVTAGALGWVCLARGRLASARTALPGVRRSTRRGRLDGGAQPEPDRADRSAGPGWRSRRRGRGPCSRRATTTGRPPVGVAAGGHIQRLGVGVAGGVEPGGRAVFDRGVSSPQHRPGGLRDPGPPFRGPPGRDAGGRPADGAGLVGAGAAHPAGRPPRPRRWRQEAAPTSTGQPKGGRP